MNVEPGDVAMEGEQSTNHDDRQKWKQFLQDARQYENVVVVCADGEYRTHRLLIIDAHFLKYLLMQDDLVEDSWIFVPDFTVAQVQRVLCPFLFHQESDVALEDKSISQLQLILFHKPDTIETELTKGQRSEVKENLKYGTIENGHNDELYNQNGSDPNNRKDNYNSDEDRNENFKKNVKKKIAKVKSSNTSSRKVNKKDADENVKCEDCGNEFSDFKYLASHITKAHPEKSHLSQYISKQELSNYKCKLCNKEFSVSRRLRYHLKIKHKVGAKFVCETCNKLFYYEYELESHKKFHFGTRDHECDVCGKKFFQLKLLQQHKISMHSTREQKEKTKRFVCSTCAKTFFRKGALQEHEFLHSDSKQFSCNTCGKLFRQASGLRVHTNRYHSGIGPKPNTEEKKEKMRNYMKRYRAMKMGKIPNDINHRYVSELDQNNGRQICGKLREDVQVADLPDSRQHEESDVTTVYLTNAPVSVPQQDIYSQQAYTGVYILP